ncbi:MAG TPA: hypothetical protein VGD40_04165 [Chryseosolibacter sp.]
MKQFVLLIFLLVAPNGIHAQATQISYKEHLKLRVIFDSATSLMGRGQWRQALRAYKIASVDLDTRSLCFLYSAVCYLRMGQKARCLVKIDEAFKSGLLFKYLLNYSPLTEIMSEAEEHYREQRPFYLQKIDSVLGKELQYRIQLDQSVRRKYSSLRTKLARDSMNIVVRKTDSLNIVRLTDIVNIYGWPGATLIGDIQTNPDWIESPTLLVIHNDEKTNLRFLQIVEAAAKARSTHWFEAEQIMTNLLWRFYDNRMIKLRHLVFNKRGRLRIDMSLLQLQMIAHLIRDNPNYRLVFFPTKFIGDHKTNSKHAATNLKQIGEFLVSYGISPTNFQISNEIVEVQDDHLGLYKIAFRRERLLQ